MRVLAGKDLFLRDSLEKPFVILCIRYNILTMIIRIINIKISIRSVPERNQNSLEW